MRLEDAKRSQVIRFVLDVGLPILEHALMYDVDLTKAFSTAYKKYLKEDRRSNEDSFHGDWLTNSFRGGR